MPLPLRLAGHPLRIVPTVLLAAILVAGAVHADPARAGGETPGAIVGHVAADTTGAGPAITLPTDEARHPGYLIEWWQFWLHLKSKDGRTFGATVTFFDLPAEDGLRHMGAGVRRTDFRITDDASGRSHGGSVFSQKPVTPVPNGFALDASGQRARGSMGDYELHIAADHLAIDAKTRANREPVVLFDENGVYRAHPVESARLYEWQRMPTRGTIRIADQVLKITGTTWFEHGWVNMPSLFAAQWEYFQLELDDGRDAQIAQVRRYPGGPVYLYEGTIRTPDGSTRYLQEGDFEIVSTGRWRRDATCSYPSGWKIRLLDDHLTMTPTVLDQEIEAQTPPFLWDGNTRISGDVTGRGIAEFLNHCQTPRPEAVPAGP